MKALVEIPPLDLKALKLLCEVKRISRSEAVRRAIKRYLRENPTSDTSKIDKAFGLWKNNPVDGLVYQQKIRAEWER